MKTGSVSRWACLALAVACSDKRDEAVSEATSTASQALDQGCKNATPVASFNNSLQHVSPLTYSSPGCFKAQVVQLLLTGNSVFIPTGAAGSTGSGGSPSWGGAGGAGGSVPGVVTTSPDVVVESPNPNLNTQASCEAAWIGGYRFDFDQAQGGYVTVDMKSERGVFSQGRCQLKFTFSDLPVGGLYRFAVSARTSQASGAPTQSFAMYLAP